MVTPMSHPLVTVVIPTKNAKSVFKKVLLQVQLQVAPFEFCILIIDSGSSDGTVEWARAEAQKDDRIKVIEILPIEFGHGKTRNLGVSSAKSEYVAFLTHDATPFDERWLSELLKPLIDDPKVAGVFGRHVAYPDCNAIISNDLKLHFDAFSATPTVQIDDPGRYREDENYRKFLHFYSDNNSALRKSVWEKIPYPEIDFAEDQAWAKLIIEAGWKKAYADQACVFHSHSYSVTETLRRAFDESRALSSLFGYKLCPHLYQVPLRAGKKTLKDWYFLFHSRQFCSSWWLLPFLNMSKIIGFYLGDQKWFSRRFGSLISLDQSLKRKNG